MRRPDVNREERKPKCEKKCSGDEGRKKRRRKNKVKKEKEEKEKEKKNKSRIKCAELKVSMALWRTLKYGEVRTRSPGQCVMPPDLV